MQDQQPCGVQLRDKLCRGNRGTVTNRKNQDQPQTTKSVGQSPELEQACGAWQGSCTGRQERGEPVIEEIVAEGERKRRDKENIHFWDKRYTSGGTQQELLQAVLPCCSATAPRWRHPLGLHCRILPLLPDTGCQGGHGAQRGSR